MQTVLASATFPTASNSLKLARDAALPSGTQVRNPATCRYDRRVGVEGGLLAHPKKNLANLQFYCRLLILQS